MAPLNEERLTSRRQFGAMRHPVEQLHLEFGFEILDPLTERRLTDAELGRRAGEVALLSDSQEVANVAEFQDIAESNRDDLR